tara:strand:- start:343 stop:579 length:237 start_codon:yes stop_codon:yes gene_type:complete
MTIEYDQQEFVNEYIARQNKAIADLTSKSIMLESRLAMAEKKIQELTGEEEEIMDAGKFGEDEKEKDADKPSNKSVHK